MLYGIRSIFSKTGIKKTSDTFSDLTRALFYKPLRILPRDSVWNNNHRPAYGSDGDYYSKPNRETIFQAVYRLMRESDPARFPEIL